MEIEIPSRGLSDGAAETKKGRAARTRAGEKYISARGDLVGGAGSKEAETADVEDRTTPPFIHTEAERNYISQCRVVV
jgi:hypothetical protein